jgi:DNA replication and repair protein RecF
MRFSKISLENFRNYQSLKLQFDSKVIILVGPNGSGKTNIIEGLSLLSSGSSFRTNSKSHFIRNQSNSKIASKIDNFQTPLTSALAQGTISRGLLDDDLKVVITKSTKENFVNGKKTSAGNLKTEFPSVIFSPESLSSIKEGPEVRRALLDEVICNSPEYGAQTVADFQKVLKSRNKVLRDHSTGVRSTQQTLPVLESLEVQFLRYATLLTRHRLEVLREYLPEIRESFSRISNQKDVDISVDYVISGRIANDWDAETIMNTMRYRLRELASAELSLGTSLVGPHKHDVRFLYCGNDSRFFCSQGQQRALILAFKIAQIIYHRRTFGLSPILFLDDVLSELDSDKREFLLRFLGEHESQTFITTTDLNQLGKTRMEDAQIIWVRNGNVHVGDKCSTELRS